MTHETARRRKRKRQKRARLLSTLPIVGILMFGAYFLGANSNEAAIFPSDTHAAPSPESAEGAPNSSELPAMAENSLGHPIFNTQVHTREIADTQYLKLVNRERSVTAPVSDATLVTVWPAMSARDRYVTLHETAFYAVRELFAAAREAGHRDLFVASGFRSHEHQAELYQNAQNRDYVLPPGHSEHQLGLAADIAAGPALPSMVGSPEAKWLAENATQFGLILRYPADKQEITRVAYEPWHFRYVGRIHAWYMRQQGFVLEEYIEYLQGNGGVQAELDGRMYYILYQRPEDGLILVPNELDFQISTANTGGYIVTAWQ